MNISKIILRIHGTVLVIVTLTLTYMGWLSYCCGTGVYGDILLKQPIGFIGLFQAYLLMTVVGIALWVASYGKCPEKFHWLGLCSHLVPLAANIVFWNELDRHAITHTGIIIHMIMILIESFGIIRFQRLNTLT